MPWLARDLRLALRVLRKEVAFTALAVLTLGLGIGAATTIYSVIDAVLFNPYPYAHIERNVALEVRDLSREGAGGRTFFKLPELLDYKEQVQSFEDVIAGGFTDVLYTTAQGTEQFTGGLMSGNNFEFLGIPAARGRTLVPEDARPGAPPVCVMRHTTWATRFGSDPGVLGRTFVLNGVPTTVVGIMPPRFHTMAADFYLPVSLDRADPEQRDRFFRLQARLKPGVTLAEAEAEVNLVARRVATLYPSEYPERFTVKVVTWVDNIIGQFRTTLYTLAAAVGLLLLIACSNVANMLLGRATTREREPLYYLVSTESVVGREVRDHRRQGSYPEGGVIWDRQVMHWLRPLREPDMATCLAHPLVPKSPEEPCELSARKVPRQSHTARSSSRTKWRRTNCGRAASSKWQRTASRTFAWRPSRVSASVNIEAPSARAV